VSEAPYIDAPERLTRRERTFGAIVTAVMWAAYAYLWLPLVSLAAWGLGLEVAYDVMIRAGGIESLRRALFWYLVVLADVALTVAVWSLVNKWRFAGRNRRTGHEPIGDEALAHYFGVAPELLTKLRENQRIELDIDASGRPAVPGAPTPDTGTASRDQAA
jgi:biofilm PGA synthesis protein PgaD